MNLQDAQLLRIFIGESDKHQGRPLYEVIVEAARTHKIAGATVLRGALGFGASHQLHAAKVLHLSENLPLVIELVDAPERIAAFLPELEQWITDGMATLEQVQVIVYRKGG